MQGLDSNQRLNGMNVARDHSSTLPYIQGTNVTLAGFEPAFQSFEGLYLYLLIIKLLSKNFAESALVIKYYKQETLFIWRQGEILLSLGC